MIYPVFLSSLSVISASESSCLWATQTHHLAGYRLRQIAIGIPSKLVHFAVVNVKACQHVLSVVTHNK